MMGAVGKYRAINVSERILAVTHGTVYVCELQGTFGGVDGYDDGAAKTATNIKYYETK